MSDKANSDLEQDIIGLRDKIKETTAKADVAKEAADTYLNEVKSSGLDPVSGTKDEDKEAFKRLDAAYKDADVHYENAAELKRRLDTLAKQATREAIDISDGDPGHPAQRQLLNMGERFLASEQYRALKRSGVLEMGNTHVNVPPVTVSTREQTMKAVFPRAALLDGDPLVPEDQRLIPVVGIPARQLRVRDLVEVSQTDSDTVEYVEETTRTDTAAETPYGTLAPEATYAYTRKSVAVKRIPHAIPATKGNLADQAQLRGLLDNRLAYGVGKRIDGQMVNGDGVGDNIEGIRTNAAVPELAGLGILVTDFFHQGMTNVRINLEDEPTGFLVHPTDYEVYNLTKGSDGHYQSKRSTAEADATTIWGKPAVISTVVPQGTALVANWRMGATLWVRSGIVVSASDSHTDFFTKGLVMLLAEMRAAFTTVQPLAFTELTGIGT